MTDTLKHSDVSTPRRSTMLAIWTMLAALWVAPYFISFRGFSKGFVWQNPLGNDVRPPDCGLANAPFPDTCADRGTSNGSAALPKRAEEVDAGEKANPTCVDLVPTRRTSATSAVDPRMFPIDDLEGGDSVPYWYYSNDGRGMQFPAPCAIRSALRGERGDANVWAMHTYGRSAEGFAWATIGRLLRSSPPNCDRPFDATAFKGVRFWAKGPGGVRFAIGIVATTPPPNGTCNDACFDAYQTVVDLTATWAKYEIPFATLTQVGWGTPADFDASQILDVNWSPYEPVKDRAALCFDFWIDDVVFYR